MSADLRMLVTFVRAKVELYRCFGWQDWRSIGLDELNDPNAIESALREGQALGLWTWTRTADHLRCVVSEHVFAHEIPSEGTP